MLLNRPAGVNSTQKARKIKLCNPVFMHQVTYRLGHSWTCFSLSSDPLQSLSHGTVLSSFTAAGGSDEHIKQVSV